MRNGVDGLDKPGHDGDVALSDALARTFDDNARSGSPSAAQFSATERDTAFQMRVRAASALVRFASPCSIAGLKLTDRVQAGNPGVVSRRPRINFFRLALPLAPQRGGGELFPWRSKMFRFFEALIDPFRDHAGSMPPANLLGYYGRYCRQVWPLLVALMAVGLVVSLIEVTILRLRRRAGRHVADDAARTRFSSATAASFWPWGS